MKMEMVLMEIGLKNKTFHQLPVTSKRFKLTGGGGGRRAALVYFAYVVHFRLNKNNGEDFRWRKDRGRSPLNLL